MIDPTTVKSVARQQVMSFLKKASHAPPQGEPLSVPIPSRIKMIAVGIQNVTVRQHEVGRDPKVRPSSMIFTLTHDDRIFVYDAEETTWHELPPLPE